MATLQQIPVTECLPVWGMLSIWPYITFRSQNDPSRSVIMAPFYRWRNWVSDTLIDLAMATQVPDGSQNAILDLFTLKVCYLSMAPAASSCILLYTQSLQEHLCYRRCSTGVFGSIDSHLLILSPLCGIPSLLLSTQLRFNLLLALLLSQLMLLCLLFLLKSYSENVCTHI